MRRSKIMFFGAGISTSLTHILLHRYNQGLVPDNIGEIVYELKIFLEYNMGQKLLSSYKNKLRDKESSL